MKEIKLPDNFAASTEALVEETWPVEGYLSRQEMRFLALLGAIPTADGEVLEIGSFKGKSTIILAKSARSTRPDVVINAVDPMTAPSETDPKLGGLQSSFPDFDRNIRVHGVAANVRLHQMFSRDLAETWDKPIRLLWIDGDHTYAGTKADFDGFAEHLSDGAIVAIHDALHEFEGGARVFAESILRSPNFGACGFCGSIAWGQFHVDPADSAKFGSRKRTLLKKVDRVLPYIALGESLRGWKRKRYRFYRLLVPHGAVDPAKWIAQIDTVD
ncbi:MAG: class I SAM-dependent methyltransferase [Acidobacteria bacterium]|nr:class I SAM-dependent methyltransferase [Acidobacteriota bacterium]